MSPAAPKVKRPVQLPHVLFEGDHPPMPLMSGPGRRYALGPSAPALHAELVEELGELPESYGTKRLFLAARDPHWLYAHWDFTLAQLREHNALSADRHLVLRVFAGGASDTTPAVEIHVHPESRNWFVHVGRGGTKYFAELGYYARADRHWHGLARSESTLTPPDLLAPEAAVEFATIPIEVPFETLVALVEAAAKEHIPLAEAILQLRAAGYPGLPEPEAWSTLEWTPEREQALAEAVASVISMDSVRRVWIGSMEITELLRRKLLGQLASAAVGSVEAGPGELGAGPGGPGSVSSPMGKARVNRGFWFNVNAELILYGATEPDAVVTIGGRTIRLRPDGSFSFRFALPDGRYELPAVAVAVDGQEQRSADLRFSRDTQYGGEVGLHPQDAVLKKPDPANVS